MNINEIYHGDNLELMRKMPEGCIDLVATDPPYGINFMSKNWDKALPPQETFNEILRVLKPGAFCFVFASPRQDVLWRMMSRLETAGFMIDFPSIYWTYATGIGLGANCGKLIDKRLGMERGREKKFVGNIKNNSCHAKNAGENKRSWEMVQDDTPISDLAKQYNEAYIRYRPKSAVEVIVVAMKPVEGYLRSQVWEKHKVDYFESKSEKKGVVTVTKKAINPALCDEKWIDGKLVESKPYRDTLLSDYATTTMMTGKACTWLDRVRVPVDRESEPRRQDLEPSGSHGYTNESIGFYGNLKSDYGNQIQKTFHKGRYPTNLLVQDDLLDTGEYAESKAGIQKAGNCNKVYGKFSKEHYTETPGDSGSFSRYFCFDAWCREKLPKTYPFLPVPKPPPPTKQGRDAHLTEKPVQIFAYLITLASRPGDIVMDPFLGSGTCCLAAAGLNRDYLGCDLEKNHVDIAKYRLGKMIVKKEAKRL